MCSLRISNKLNKIKSNNSRSNSISIDWLLALCVLNLLPIASLFRESASVENCPCRCLLYKAGVDCLRLFSFCNFFSSSVGDIWLGGGVRGRLFCLAFPFRYRSSCLEGSSVTLRFARRGGSYPLREFSLECNDHQSVLRSWGC